MTRNILRRANGWILIKTILVMAFISSECAMASHTPHWSSRRSREVSSEGSCPDWNYFPTSDRAKARFSFASR